MTAASMSCKGEKGLCRKCSLPRPKRTTFILQSFIAHETNGLTVASTEAMKPVNIWLDEVKSCSVLFIESCVSQQRGLTGWTCLACVTLVNGPNWDEIVNKRDSEALWEATAYTETQHFKISQFSQALQAGTRTAASAADWPGSCTTSSWIILFIHAHIYVSSCHVDCWYCHFITSVYSVHSSPQSEEERCVYWSFFNSLLYCCLFILNWKGFKQGFLLFIFFFFYLSVCPMLYID